jgi:SAM-dependent methyltransferase
MKSLSIQKEKREKHENELQAFNGECNRLVHQTDIENQQLRTVVSSLEKFIKEIKDENITADMSVKVGELCFEIRLIENAQYFFQRAVALDRGNSNAHNDLGVLYCQKGQFKIAEGFFKKALDLDHENMDAHRNLTLLCENAGQLTSEDTGEGSEKIELRDMSAYWDDCAQDNAMRHIATDDWQSEAVFHKCGERDLANLLKNLDGEFLNSHDKQVLEIGCGIGRMMKPFTMWYPDLNITGVDVSEEMLRKGRARLKEFKNVTFLRSNGKDLKIFEDNSFNFIYSYVVLQHIPRKFVHSYFGEVSRILDEKGFFVFQMPMRTEERKPPEPPDSDFRTLRYYSLEDVHMLCRSKGLTIVNTTRCSEDSLWFTATKFDK